jgi:hypothetical protein
MGGKQSRVETSDVQTELHTDAEQDGRVESTISITPALRDQIQNLQQGKTAVDGPQLPLLTPEYGGFPWLGHDTSSRPVDTESRICCMFVDKRRHSRSSYDKRT